MKTTGKISAFLLFSFLLFTGNVYSDVREYYWYDDAVVGSAEDTICGDGYYLTASLWARAVLEIPGHPVVLKWKMIGTDITESGDQVVNGYFYADPDDFAYGSEYNPELFVKIYIATNGWCNIAFNHVTVDPVSIDSEHIGSAFSALAKSGTVTLSKRLLEHRYDDVAIDYNLDYLEEAPATSNAYIWDMWAEAYILGTKLIWKMVGKDTTPSGDQVVSGYFYGSPNELKEGSIYNPEVYVKIYVAKNGWANIAFNHVTVNDVEISSAHHYSGQADHAGTISLDSRLLEHQYEGVVASDETEKNDIIASNSVGGTVLPVLFGNPENPLNWTISVPNGGSQTYLLKPKSGYFLKEIIIDGKTAGDGNCTGYYTVQNVSKPTSIEGVFVNRIVGGNALYGLNAADVCVDGSYAYVVNLDSGLSIVNVGNPEEPATVGWVDTQGEATGVFSSGNYVYVADGFAGLAVVDVTDPENPAVVRQVELLGKTIDVYFAGGYVYAESDECGLSVVDFSDPANPIVTGWIGASENVDDVYVSGNFAYYLSDGDFQVVNIADPANPVAFGQTDAGDAYRMAVSGNYACVYGPGYGEDNFKVIDITDPKNPAVVGITGAPGTYLVDLSVYGNYAYITHGYEYRNGMTPLTMVDMTDPMSPTIAGTISMTGRVYVAGEYAYVASGSIDIVDITHPSSLTIIGSTVDTGPESIYSSGDYLYAVQGIQGLFVLDVQDPVQPTIIGHVNTLGAASYVYFSNNYAYVVNKGKGLALVDLSDPTNPTIAGQVAMPGAREVDVVGQYAYVANDVAGLTVVDVIDPQNPVIVGTVNTPTEAYNVVVSGQYAYVGDLRTGLQVIDIKDPKNPIIVWSRNQSGAYIREVGIYGHYAFIMNYHILEVWNLMDPVNPSYVGLFSYFLHSNNMHFSGDYMYATGDRSFGIYNIKDPSKPILIDFVSKGNYPPPWHSLPNRCHKCLCFR